MSRPLDKFLTGDLVKTPRPVTMTDMQDWLSRNPKAVSGSQIQPGGGAKQFTADLADGIRMVKEALIGRPEDAVTKTGDLLEMRSLPIVDGRSLAIPFPTERGMGTLDATLAGLPLIGGTASRTGRRFFSQLEKVIGERLPNKVTTKHLLDVARKGAKAEEIKWSGLEDLVRNTPADQLWKREDLLAHVEKTAPEIREKMITQKPVGKTTGDRIRAGLDTLRPKFTTYTLSGGENHRELVVTMPGAKTVTPDNAIQTLAHRLEKAGLEPLTDDQVDILLGGVTADGNEAIGLTPEAVGMLEDMQARMGVKTDDLTKKIGDPYNVPAGHAYGDPELDVNRLFHARMNDRDGGKTLFMEELQSDWHQTGREQGYTSKEPALREGFTFRKITEDDRDQLLSMHDDDSEIGSWGLFDSDGDLTPGIVNGNLSREQALRQLRDDVPDQDLFMDISGVPDAPFKNTWQELGFRRMLQEAVDNPNYERLAWTTGAQQADRYKLSNHVDRLKYNPNTGELLGFKGRSMSPIITQNVPKDKLKDYVGKETAEKLLADKPSASFMIQNYLGGTYGPFNSMEAAVAAIGHPRDKIIENNLYNELSGVDLDLGGEGMKGFYDKILVDYANKVGKKYGVKAEKMSMPAGKSKTKFFDDIGDELSDVDLDRYINSEYQSMMENAREQAHEMTDDEIIEYAKHSMEYDEQQLEELPSRSLRNLVANDMIDKEERYWTRDRLLEELHDAGIVEKREVVPMEEVWQLPITDEMRRDLKEKGQALYAVPPVKIESKEKKQNRRIQDLMGLAPSLSRAHTISARRR